MKKKIYLDNNASTPQDPRVVQQVSRHLQECFGNPSSIHHFGREARKCLIKARDLISSCLKVGSDEIIFHSGGTEGANLVLRGVLESSPGSHVVTSSVEHSCVYQTIKALEKRGVQATFLEPGPWGAVKPEDLKQALKPNTKLIALMGANNETGVKTDIHAIADLAAEAGIPLLVDAVSLLGKESFEIPKGVSSMFFSGQKIHAPKGVGFSFIRRGLKLVPHLTGGEHEYGRRAGTENLPGIVGLAEAVAILYDNPSKDLAYMAMLRDKMEQTLMDKLPTVVVNGDGPRVVNTTNLCFHGVDGETFLALLDQNGIAASHGSACASGALEPSRVLLNMGLPLERVNSSIRFSVSRFTTVEDIDHAIATILTLLKRT